MFTAAEIAAYPRTPTCQLGFVTASACELDAAMAENVLARWDYLFTYSTGNEICAWVPLTGGTVELECAPPRLVAADSMTLDAPTVAPRTRKAR